MNRTAEIDQFGQSKMVWPQNHFPSRPQHFSGISAGQFTDGALLQSSRGLGVGGLGAGGIFPWYMGV
jgi:hypothetical protein